MRTSTRAWRRHKLKGSVIHELQEKRGEEEMTASAGAFQNTQPEGVRGAAQILPTKPLGTRMHFPPHPRASVTQERSWGVLKLVIRGGIGDGVKLVWHSPGSRPALEVAASPAARAGARCELGSADRCRGRQVPPPRAPLGSGHAVGAGGARWGLTELLPALLVPAGTAGRAAAATSRVALAGSMHRAELFSLKVNLCYSLVWEKR